MCVIGRYNFYVIINFIKFLVVMTTYIIILKHTITDTVCGEFLKEGEKKE